MILGHSGAEEGRRQINTDEEDAQDELEERVHLIPLCSSAASVVHLPCSKGLMAVGARNLRKD